MNNEELGRLHLESKRRRTGKEDEEEQEKEQQEKEQQVLLPLVNQQEKYVMCLDLTDEVEDEDCQPHVQQQRQRVAVARRALPLQDIELLEEAEKEFGEVIRPCGTSKDRLKKSRGRKESLPIVVCDDILCDCRVRCLEGYECHKNKHVQCINLVRKEGDILKCYLCGSKIV
jgi:hypothetical protein